MAWFCRLSKISQKMARQCPRDSRPSQVPLACVNKTHVAAGFDSTCGRTAPFEPSGKNTADPFPRFVVERRQGAHVGLGVDALEFTPDGAALLRLVEQP